MSPLTLLGVLFLLQVSSGAAAEKNRCTIYEKWNQGIKGNLYIYLDIPKPTKKWQVKMVFNQTVVQRDMDAHEGINEKCKGNVCTFTNDNFNAIQKPGDHLVLGYKARSGTVGTKKELGLLEAYFNGQLICGEKKEEPVKPKVPKCTFYEEWNQGVKGKLDVDITETVQKWNVRMVFNKTLCSTCMDAFRGQKELCSGKECKFVNENHNAYQVPGAKLTLPYKVDCWLRNGNCQPRTKNALGLVAAYFNGKLVCGDDTA